MPCTVVVFLIFMSLLEPKDYISHESHTKPCVWFFEDQSNRSQNNLFCISKCCLFGDRRFSSYRRGICLFEIWERSVEGIRMMKWRSRWTRKSIVSIDTQLQSAQCVWVRYPVTWCQRQRSTLLSDSVKAELEDTMESKHVQKSINERHSVECPNNVFIALVEQEWWKGNVWRSCFRVYISLYFPRSLSWVAPLTHLHTCAQAWRNNKCKTVMFCVCKLLGFMVLAFPIILSWLSMRESLLHTNADALSHA